MQQRSSYLVNKILSSYWFIAILTSVSITLNTIIDSVIVGQLIGTAGLAAVTLSMPLIKIISVFNYLISVGSSIQTAFAIGKGNQVEANSYFSYAILINMTIGTLFVLIGIFFSEQVASRLCSDIELQPLVHEYIKVVLLTAPFYFLMTCLSVFIKTDGKLRLASLVLIICSITNVVMDIALIKYCNLGIMGASLATSLTYMAGFLFLLICFFGKKCSLKLCYPIGKVNPCRILETGAPGALISMLTSVRLLGINHLVLEYLGQIGVATLAVVANLSLLSEKVTSGIIQATQPVGAVLIGQEDYKGFQYIIRKSMKIFAIISCCIFLSIQLFPNSLLDLFGVADRSVANSLRIASLSPLLTGIILITMNTYQLLQKKRLALIVAFTQPLLVIPVMYLFAQINTSLIWLAFVVGELIMLTIIWILSEHTRRSNKSLSPFLLFPPPTPGETSIDLSMKATEEELIQFLLQLDKFLQDLQINASTRNKVQLCCEELILNIVNHGDIQHNTRHIDLILKVSKCDINICIRDNGRPFNPVEYSDTHKEGVGLTLVRGFCQKIEYQYLFNQNTVFIKIDQNGSAVL